MSRHRTGSGSPSGKGRPTPKRTGTGVKSRPTPTRSTRTRGPVYRQRRYPPLPLAWKLVLVAVWVGALVATVLLVEPVLGQIGVMAVVTGVLPLAVVLLRDPARRRR